MIIIRAALFFIIFLLYYKFFFKKYKENFKSKYDVDIMGNSSKFLFGIYIFVVLVPCITSGEIDPLNLMGKGVSLWQISKLILVTLPSVYFIFKFIYKNTNDFNESIKATFFTWIAGFAFAVIYTYKIIVKVFKYVISFVFGMMVTEVLNDLNGPKCSHCGAMLSKGQARCNCCNRKLNWS